MTDQDIEYRVKPRLLRSPPDADQISELVTWLLHACEVLDAGERCATSSSTADQIRADLFAKGYTVRWR